MNRNNSRSSERLIFDQLLSNRTVLNEGTDDELNCHGYKYSRWRNTLFPLLVLVTGGFILLLMSWKPQLKCYLLQSKCSLQSADTILVQDAFHNFYVCEIKVISFTGDIPNDREHFQPVESDSSSDTSESSDKALLVEKRQQRHSPTGSWIVKYNKSTENYSSDDNKTGNDLKYFDHQHVRYIWDQGSRNFHKLLDLSTNVSCISIQENFQGLTEKEQAQKYVKITPYQLLWKLIVVYYGNKL